MAGAGWNLNLGNSKAPLFPAIDQYAALPVGDWKYIEPLSQWYLWKQLVWCSGLDTVDQRPGSAINNRQVLNLFPEKEFLNPPYCISKIKAQNQALTGNSILM